MPDRSVYNSRTRLGGYNEFTVKTPNYWAIKKAGLNHLLPENPYLFERRDSVTPIVSATNGYETYTYRELNGGPHASLSAIRNGYVQNPNGSPRGASFVKAEDMHFIVANKLAAKSRDAPIDLGVSLGEYRETAKLFLSTSKKVVQLARAVKKADFSLALRTVTGRSNKKPSDAAKAAADAWLGWSYGVRPLINDMSGAMEALNDDRPVVPVHTIRASHKEHVHSKAYWDVGNPTFGSEITITGDMKCSGLYQFFVENPLSFTLDQLGLLNPLSLGWELIPLSFVVDWFLPIGGVLRGVIPPPGIESLRGYTYLKGDFVGYEWMRWDSAITTKAEASTMLKLKERNHFFGFPQVRLIVPDLSLSYSEIGSGLALLTNLRR